MSHHKPVVTVGSQQHCMQCGSRTSVAILHFCLLGERTHQIPIEGLAKKEDTFRKIWLELLRFVNPEQTAIFPPVYCRVSWCTCKISKALLGQNSDQRHGSETATQDIRNGNKDGLLTRTVKSTNKIAKYWQRHYFLNTQNNWFWKSD